MTEFFLRPAVLVPAVAVAAYLIHQLFFAGPKLPKLPVVGARDGDWFPFYQAMWRNTFNFKAAVKQADEQFRDQAVLMPLIGNSNMVLLPRSQIQFVTDQPDSVLDMHAAAIESLQIDYTCTDPYLVHNPVHHKLITTTLTNQIGNLVPDVAEETAWAFEQRWGSPDEYQEVCVYDTLRKIVGCVTNRVFLGKPKHGLRPRRAPDFYSTAHGVETRAATRPRPRAQRLPPVDHQAGQGDRRPQEYIDELRAEIEGVLAEHGGEWNKRALAKMQKLDSVMRESARLNSFVTVGLNRAVAAKDGLVTPDGIRIPRGATVSVPSYPIFHDSAVYPDADEFKPFRFAEQRSDASIEYVQRAAKAFATTSTDFLAFGHGRNACPGRFFAANELKLMLAHLVLNYDVELGGERPRNTWFGLNRVPPLQATIRIKRRERA
ncbi:cytochrome P450 [Parathielavia appendiculata]|uniref:Cytochrome P450 n=1 Tax=Parathielavia appendiculata TaxID=2587402 RepID=A0AAN6TUI2_9PEZI|nr:cytochrome P450 [Parathielavia appendiculata]